jgi:hypothetical protein
MIRALKTSVSYSLHRFETNRYPSVSNSGTVLSKSSIRGIGSVERRCISSGLNRAVVVFIANIHANCFGIDSMHLPQARLFRMNSLQQGRGSAITDLLAPATPAPIKWQSYRLAPVRCN